jgi:glycerol-3-phosphate O-acyltransferase
LKSPKTGLLHAALQADRRSAVIVPMAVSYDLVLEDHVLAHQGAKRRQRPFAREIAEMVRYAVGYQSRAFVTFGQPIPLDGCDPDARRDVMALAHRIRDTIGRLYKVLPTSIVAAIMSPSIGRRELESRARGMIDALQAAGANLDVDSAREVVDQGAALLAARNIIHVERGGRLRVRERTVLRYYARMLQHLLSDPPRQSQTH